MAYFTSDSMAAAVRCSSILPVLSTAGDHPLVGGPLLQIEDFTNGMFSAATAHTMWGPQSTGSGSRTHRGMWSLTLCSNLAVKSDLSEDESSRYGRSNIASLKRFPNSNTP